jgi:hypothetical protein
MIWDNKAAEVELELSEEYLVGGHTAVNSDVRS